MMIVIYIITLEKIYTFLLQCIFRWSVVGTGNIPLCFQLKFEFCCEIIVVTSSVSAAFLNWLSRQIIRKIWPSFDVNNFIILQSHILLLFELCPFILFTNYAAPCLTHTPPFTTIFVHPSLLHRFALIFAPCF